MSGISTTGVGSCLVRSLRFRAAWGWTILALFVLGRPATAQVPALLGHQGRVMVSGAFFEGAGKFKFALVNATATQTYWRNSADANADGQPDDPVTLTVTRGLYSVSLGDTTVPFMAALSPATFATDAVFLRVWFDDGTHGYQRLDPDHRVTAVGYALVASTVPDGSLGAAKLAPGVLSLANLTGVLAPSQMPAGFPIVSERDADPDLLAAGFRRFFTVPSAPWVPGTPTDAPGARSGHSGLWTGQQFLVWGGSPNPGRYFGSGGAYEPGPDRWLGVSSVDGPAPRSGHAAVWTGTEMMVWGGLDGGGYLNTGGRYDAARTTWRAMSTTGAPTERLAPAAVWTGSRLLLFGGRNDTGILAGGGVYDPAMDSWGPLPVAGLPAARLGPVSIWTGSQWLVWGGRGSSGLLASGARLTTSGGVPGTWSAMATLNAPSARSESSAVWTGQRLLVWGGKGSGTDPYLADGGSYDPVADVWTVLPTVGAPTARSGHSAVWTGTEMLVLGGENGTGLLSSGHAFDPATGRWRELTGAGNPAARRDTAAVWTGAELLVFGGQGSSGAVGLLQRLNPQAPSHFYRKP